MKKINFYTLLLLFICGCGHDKEAISVDTARQELQELYTIGYTTKELALRSNYSEEEIVQCIQGKELRESYFDKVDWIYNENKKKNLIPICRIEKSAYDCLWKIHERAQNLPIISQYTKVGVSSVANALKKKQALNMEDSLKVMIAYINMKYELDTIPLKINVAPYYYNYNEGIVNIQVPQSYVYKYKTNNLSQEKRRLQYFIWQAEMFEREANKNLESSINKKIEQYTFDLAKEFIEDDMDSWTNTVLGFFKDDQELQKFYRDKFKSSIDTKELESELRDEIMAYCISINCSRALAINEILGYNELVDNLTIAQKVQLDNFMIEMDSLNGLIRDQRIGVVKETVVSGLSLGVDLLVTNFTGPLALISSGLVYAGLEKTFDDSYEMIAGNKLNVEEKIEKLQKSIFQQLEKNIKQQIQKDRKSYYKNALDENVKQYYSNLKTNLNLY